MAYAKCGTVTFPEPRDRNVNMMPFIFGNKTSLPESVQDYYELIENCPYMKDDVGKVGYLTVQESYVYSGQAHRRQGIHLEPPGLFKETDPCATAFTPGVERPSGVGHFVGPDKYQGGVYFASSVSDTNNVWDALVDKNVHGIVDHQGGGEPLRGIIGPGTTLKAGELIWITDATPHETLPQEKPGYRQFFRVITSVISHWYADHSTPNPKVSLPDHIKVVQRDRFGLLRP